MIIWIQLACWSFLWFNPKWKWVLCYAGVIITLRICSVLLFADMLNKTLVNPMADLMHELIMGFVELVFVSVVVFCRQKHLKHKAYLKECEKKIIQAHAKKHGIKTED